MAIDDPRAAGQRLRKAIESHLRRDGVPSLRQLAVKASVQPTTMSQWWTQGVTPEGATLNRVADALGIDVAELWRAYQGRPDVPEARTHQAGIEPALDPAILDELWVAVSAMRQELADLHAEMALLRQEQEAALRGIERGLAVATGQTSAESPSPIEPRARAGARR